jgi:hypothetical protein
MGDEYDNNIKEKKNIYIKKLCMQKFENSKYFKNMATTILQYINHYKYITYNDLYDELNNYEKIINCELDYILYDLFLCNKIVLCKNDIISISYINQYIFDTYMSLTKDELILLLIYSNKDYKILYDELYNMLEYDDISLISIFKNNKNKIYEDNKYNEQLFKQINLVLENNDTTSVNNNYTENDWLNDDSLNLYIEFRGTTINSRANQQYSN